MLYPNNIEQKLGFDKIREGVKEACISPLGRAFVEKMRFSSDYDLIDKLVAAREAQLERAVRVGGAR